MINSFIIIIVTIDFICYFNWCLYCLYFELIINRIFLTFETGFKNSSFDLKDSFSVVKVTIIILIIIVAITTVIVIITTFIVIISVFEDFVGSLEIRMGYFRKILLF